MYRCYTKITFIQQATDAFPGRNRTLIFGFVHEYEAADSWADLTNKAKITLPKNVYVRDQNNKLVSLAGTNVNLGGFTGPSPLFLRGDRVSIDAGYRHFDRQGKEILSTSRIFTGYISAVTSKKPVMLECEDNMWILKQHQAKGGKNGFFAGNAYTIESMFRELIKNAGLSFTVNALTKTSLGDYTIRDRSIAQVLEDLNKKYSFKAYFRGNELRIGSLVYVEQDNVINGQTVFKKFAFQQNIISDELEYKRKDDITLSAVAKCVDTVATGKKTKDGHPKTKKERLSVLVTYQLGKFYSYIKKPNEDFPANIEGERREFNYLPPKTPQELVTLAKEQLDRYFYTGYRGKFTTFGIPFVRQGDNITLVDPILPERNGNYKVKGVEYSGGVNGIRQVVELDYRIN